MTSKDLERLVIQPYQQQQETSQSQQELQQLKRILESKTKPGKFKPFYYWIPEIHSERYRNSNGQCCWWHIIGAPQKDGKDMPALPYQHSLYKWLGEHKRIWINKSRGLGVSEFLLRWVAYNCVTGGDWWSCLQWYDD